MHVRTSSMFAICGDVLHLLVRFLAFWIFFGARVKSFGSNALFVRGLVFFLFRAHVNTWETSAIF